MPDPTGISTDMSRRRFLTAVTAASMGTLGAVGFDRVVASGEKTSGIPDPDAHLTALSAKDATRALADLALEAKVRRFVHISTVSVHGEELPSRVDEDSPLATADPEPYCSSKALGELALGQVRAKGLETVVLRPGMICNVVRSQWGNEMVERIRTRGWPKAMHPDDVLPWVQTQNLAEMARLALTHPAAAGETFLAVDRNVALRDFFVPIANALGQPVLVPDRPPQISECRVGKLATKLGYKPVRSFDETMVGLLALAKAPH